MRDAGLIILGLLIAYLLLKLITGPSDGGDDE